MKRFQTIKKPNQPYGGGLLAYPEVLGIGGTVLCNAPGRPASDSIPDRGVATIPLERGQT